MEIRRARAYQVLDARGLLIIMPTIKLRACKYPGCPNLVRSGYCEDHARGRPTLLVKQPRRDLYNAEWDRRRRYQLSCRPWCQDCLDNGLYTEAEDVHHEHRHGGDELIFRLSPLRSLCKSCHSKHTRQEVISGRNEG